MIPNNKHPIIKLNLTNNHKLRKFKLKKKETIIKIYRKIKLQSQNNKKKKFNPKSIIINNEFIYINIKIINNFNLNINNLIL